MSTEQAPWITPNGVRRSKRTARAPTYLGDEDDAKPCPTSTLTHDLIGSHVVPATVTVRVDNEVFSVLDNDVNDSEEEVEEGEVEEVLEEEDEEEEDEVEEVLEEEGSLSSSDRTPKPSNSLSRAKLHKSLMSYKENAIILRDKADTYAFQLKQSEKRLSSLLTVRDQYDRMKISMKVLRLENADLSDRSHRAFDDVKSAKEEVKTMREQYKASLEYQKNSLTLSHEVELTTLKSDKQTLEIELKAKKDELHRTNQLLRAEEAKNVTYAQINALGAKESIKLGSFKEKAVVRSKERKDKRTQASATLQFARQPHEGYTGGFGHRTDHSSQRNEILSQFINRNSQAQAYEPTTYAATAQLHRRKAKKKKATKSDFMPKLKRKHKPVIQSESESELEEQSFKKSEIQIEEFSESESESTDSEVKSQDLL